MTMVATNPISTLKKTLLWGSAFVACLVLYQWILILTSIDPFAPYRNPSDSPFGGKVSVRMDNVSIKHYSGKTLVGSCTVGRLDLHKDRQSTDFYQVKNGLYVSNNGRFEYQSDRALWNSGNQRLYVLSGAKIRNKDMDIVADAFEYNQRTGNLFINGQIQGKLFDGKINAKSIEYSVKKGTYRIGPTKWKGAVALSAQETGDKPLPKRSWEFDSAGISTPKDKDTMIWRNVKATDGEVIVRADIMEHNRKTDVIVATGKVLYFSDKVNMSCEKAIVYRKERRAVLSGSVQMIMKPKDKQKVEMVEFQPYKPVVPEDIAKSRPPAPSGKANDQKKFDEEVRSGKSLRQYPFTILAENIEYWYAKGSRHAVITGNPQGLQDLQEGRWRYIWTNKAFYDGENEKMRMESTPGKQDTMIKNSLGDTLTADWIVFSTAEDGELFEAQALKGTITSDEDDETLPKIGGDSKKADDKAGTGGDKKADDKKSDDKKGGTGTGTGAGGNGKPPMQGWIKPKL